MSTPEKQAQESPKPTVRGKLGTFLGTFKGSVEFIAILLAASALILESLSNQRANDLQAAVIELELTDYDQRKAYAEAFEAFYAEFPINRWRGTETLWAKRTKAAISIFSDRNGRGAKGMNIQALQESYSVISAYAQALDLCGKAGSCQSQFTSKQAYGCGVINQAAIGQRLLTSLRRLLPKADGTMIELSAKTRDQDWWRTHGGQPQGSHIRAYDIHCVPNAKI